MNMNENDLFEQLKKSSGNINPPASLSPDRIEEMLRREQGASSAPSPKKSGKIIFLRYASMAAACALVVAVSWQAGRISGQKTGEETLMQNSGNPGSSSITLLSETESDTISADELFTEVPSAPVTLQNTADAEADEASTETAADLETAADDTFSDTLSVSEASAPDTGTETQAQSSATDSADTQPDTKDTSGSSVNLNASSSDASSLKPADSYETIYQTLFDAFGGNTYDVTADTGARNGEIALYSIAESAAGDQAAAVNYAGDSSPDYSETNIQEQGVDEGDLVKTDGRYIYVLKRSGTLVIVDTKDKSSSSMTIASITDLSASEQPQELYVQDDRLSLITSEYYSEMDTDGDVISSRSGNRTHLYTYDISDRKSPTLAGTFTQEGSYTQSRKNGNYIYLFTSFSPIIRDTYDRSSIVPFTSQGSLSASDIYIPDYLNTASYLVVSSVNLDTPDQAADQKAVVSAATNYYISQENIYIANEDWSQNTTRTNLLKLHYENGSITGAAAGYVDGYLNDSFSMNEYQGYLRVVSTCYDDNYNETNALYILDENLNMTGSIHDLAPDETIRSARFLGNTGYFVTFRQTDPLFSVDLSDPADPQIIGDLKITGFSSYLHFYSDTLLLGLGYEADPSTGIRTGLKLSMFDISDPAHVTEVDKLVLDGITKCDSLDNYKSILIDPEKNLLGFACDNRYLVFSYDPEKGFVKEFIYDFYNDMINESLEQNSYQAQVTTAETDTDTTPDSKDTAAGSSDTKEATTDKLVSSYWYDLYTDDSATRGLYIGDTLYLVRPNSITAFDMADRYSQSDFMSLK